jgi:hypothetical protein
MRSKRQCFPPSGVSVVIHRVALLVVVKFGNDIEPDADAVSGNVRLWSELICPESTAGGSI